MLPAYVTLVVTYLGIFGTLGGVFLGQRMSQSWQREQWLRDNRKEEFRELLNALADHYRIQLEMYEGCALDPEQERLLVNVYSNAVRVIQSRIFVADMVKRYKVEVRWVEAIRAYNNTFDVAALAGKFEEIRYQIVKEASLDIGHSTSSRKTSHWWKSR